MASWTVQIKGYYPVIPNPQTPEQRSLPMGDKREFVEDVSVYPKIKKQIEVFVNAMLAEGQTFLRVELDKQMLLDLAPTPSLEDAGSKANWSASAMPASVTIS